MALSTDIVEYIEDYGKPVSAAPLSNGEKAELDARLPPDLVDFLHAYGRAVFEDGRLQLCHPDDLAGVLGLVFGNDPDFATDLCSAYAFSAFGEIFAWHRRYGLTIVDCLAGKITCDMLTKALPWGEHGDKTFIVPFGKEADFYNRHCKPLFKRARKALGPIGIGECYGFVPTLAFCGLADLEHLQRLRAAEHLAIVVQTIGFQLVDVEGYGVLKVVRPIG